MNAHLKVNDFDLSRPVAESVESFLRDLAEPTLIRVPGRQSSRCRMVVTLLHGNEPSGVIAIHRYLRDRIQRDGYRPRTDLCFFVAGVQNALVPPLFSQRQKAGDRDLNRCFLSPHGDGPGEIAAQILDCIAKLKPEAVIDIHNTSGAGPAFSVCSRFNRRHLALTELFTHRMVVTDLVLGALIDMTREDMPVVTIECGGSEAEEAHEIAYRGLERVGDQVDLFEIRSGTDVDLYIHPVRLELVPGTRICYGHENSADCDLVLPPDIDRRNFGMVTPDIMLAWVNNPGCLRLKSAAGYSAIDDYFRIRNGRLYSAHPLKLFMVTTRPAIALSDCLLYAVKELDHSHLVEQ